MPIPHRIPMARLICASRFAQLDPDTQFIGFVIPTKLTYTRHFAEQNKWNVREMSIKKMIAAKDLRSPEGGGGF